MIANFAELLNPEGVETVHQASLEILQEVGLLVHNRKARLRYSRHGCHVDHESQIVKFPSQVVEHFCQAFPQKFTFHARNPEFDRTLPDDGPVFTTGSSVPDIIDMDTGQVRRARSKDIALIAHLVNELPGYELFAIPVIANDAPPGRYHLSRYYPAVRHSIKPIFGSAPSADELEDIMRLEELVAGNAGEYRQRPFLTFGVCPVISPLVLDNESTEMLMYFAENQVPYIFITAPNAGMTSPMSLLGTLAQCNAEFLATAVLSQMSYAGTPVMYDALPTLADMRSGSYAPGGIETAIMMMGCAQMARYYDVPSAGFIGLTNAKTNDAQSGYETGLSTMAALNAGIDLFHLGGLLDGLSVFDYAKLLIDAEIAMMLKRVVGGFEESPDGFALDVIKQVGAGDTFLNNPHTRKEMRETAFIPQLSDRQPRSRWEESGGFETHQRAMQIVREMLTKEISINLSPEIHANILTEYADMEMLVKD